MLCRFLWVRPCFVLQVKTHSRFGFGPLASYGSRLCILIPIKCNPLLCIALVYLLWHSSNWSWSASQLLALVLSSIVMPTTVMKNATLNFPCPADGDKWCWSCCRRVVLLVVMLQVAFQLSKCFLSVSFLLHLGLIGKLQVAGFVIFMLASSVEPCCELLMENAAWSCRVCISNSRYWYASVFVFLVLRFTTTCYAWFAFGCKPLSSCYWYLIGHVAFVAADFMMAKRHCFPVLTDWAEILNWYDNRPVIWLWF